MRWLTCIAAVLLAGAVHGQTMASETETPGSAGEEALGWLRGQINPRTGLLAGHTGTETCWLYGQALAVVAFSASDPADRVRAKRVLSFLHDHATRPADGECFWYFAYGPDGRRGTDYTTTAVNAWVALAATQYELRTGDRQFRSMVGDVLTWIRCRCSRDVLGARGVVMGHVDHPSTRRDDTAVFSAEHNIDTYAACRLVATCTGDHQAAAMAEQLRRFLTTVLWDGERFLGGVTLPDRLNHALYLDAQTWGVLALGDDYAVSLDRALAGCSVSDRTKSLNGKTVTGISGLTEWPGTTHFWAEGTEGMVAALQWVGRTAEAVALHDQTLRLARGLDPGPGDGVLGIPHASDDGKGLAPTESVASTAWFVFNEQSLNPFAEP